MCHGALCVWILIYTCGTLEQDHLEQTSLSPPPSPATNYSITLCNLNIQAVDFISTRRHKIWKLFFFCLHLFDLHAGVIAHTKQQLSLSWTTLRDSKSEILTFMCIDLNARPPTGLKIYPLLLLLLLCVCVCVCCASNKQIKLGEKQIPGIVVWSLETIDSRLFFCEKA